MPQFVQRSPDDTTRMARRVHNTGVSVFSEMTRLAVEHQAVNLSQGFPDFPAPEWLKEAAIGAISRDINQYAPSTGSTRLRKAIIVTTERRTGLAFDENLEVTVTNGATEAISDVLQALVNPGDHVVVFEPFYDSYVPGIEMAGGVPRYVRLYEPDWHFEERDLVAQFSERTRVVIVNTPHNPTGKVYSRDELELIADLCRRFDTIAVTDEVYEHLVYDGNSHVSLACLPGMRERTVTISSAAKTFSVTGWKIGYVLAPPDLSEALRRVHQFVTFCSPAPFEDAIAYALETAEERGYYYTLGQEYTARRDMLFASLDQAGLNPIMPQGTFFIMSDIGGLGFDNDVDFARFMTAQVGVACIPPSSFYHDPAEGARLARWCFAKKPETLQAAGARLARWRQLRK